jgi:hypothetical protein
MSSGALKIMRSSAVQGASAEVERELTAFELLRKRLEAEAAGGPLAPAEAQQEPVESSSDE